MKKIQHLIIVIGLFAWSLTGHAASSAAGGEQQFNADELVGFAKKVEKTLAAKGVRVFFASRVGRPKSELPPGFNYTHMGIGVYSIITTEDGRQIPGYTMYNLYQKNDKPDQSHLVQDYPVDFYNGVFELRTGIVIPKPELQRRILEVINSQTYKDLHNPKYSAISNPYNRQYQNCTEHTLDVINAAIYKTADISTIKANNKKYFDRQPVKVGPFKMLFGSMFAEDITMNDHDDNIATATYTSIADYLEKYDLVQERFEILPGK
jgi:hypothetical protein